MRRLFYTAAQHTVLVRTLLILAVIVAIVIAAGTATPVLAGPDATSP